MENKRPAREVLHGNVRLAIWRNETDNGHRYSVTTERIYKDTEDSWKSTPSLHASDLGNLVIASVSASQWIQEQR